MFEKIGSKLEIFHGFNRSFVCAVQQNRYKITIFIFTNFCFSTILDAVHDGHQHTLSFDILQANFL